MHSTNSRENSESLKKIKRFYLFLFASIFIVSQLFLNIFAINYIERLLINQRLEQNQQLVKMAFDVFKQTSRDTSDSKKLVPMFQNLASKKYFNDRSFICAIDSNGYIVAHPDEKRVGLYRGDQHIETSSGLRPFAGETYLVEGIWENKEFSTVEIVSTLYDKDAKITIAAHQNKSMVDEKLWVIRLYFILFSVVLFGVLFIIGWYLTQKVLGNYVRQIEHYENDLKAFNSSVSHDLRAPLRSIDGFSLAVLEDNADGLDEAGKDNLMRVRSASKRMDVLIGDMLHLSRVSQQEMVRKKVNLSRMAEMIAKEFREKSPERRVDFSIAPNVVVKGDEPLLRIALQNLLGNAWKYTSGHPSANIEFGVTEQKGKKAYFVRDDGAGFDMKLAGKLFGPFKRLHKGKEFEGNGIGLATVERIIRRHGGSIWAEAAVEKGATFFFTLR